MKILISDAFDPSLPGKLEVFGEVTDDTGRLVEPGEYRAVARIDSALPCMQVGCHSLPASGSGCAKPDTSGRTASRMRARPVFNAAAFPCRLNKPIVSCTGGRGESTPGWQKKSHVL